MNKIMKNIKAIGKSAGMPYPYMKVTKTVFKIEEYLK